MIQREIYMRRIRPFIDGELIKVMTGLRRSGKSVMLELIKQELRERGVEEEQMITINFEDMKYASLCTAQALHDVIQYRVKNLQKKAYLFFDEIQAVTEWEKCVNSLRVSMDCDIYLTGSNASLLSGELATLLGGRYVEFVIYPFSFSEYLASYQPLFPQDSIQDCFNRYLLLGGMPYLSNLHYSPEPCQQYLMDVFNSVQLKDVVQRNKLRDADLLERLLMYIMANVGTTFSATSLVKFFRSEHRSVSVETILNYIKYCCEAYLFYPVKRQDVPGKQILATGEKYYIADHGFREAVFGGNQRDIQRVLENIVFMELLRRNYKVSVGKVGEKEVDFVCEKKGEKLYVQVTYLLAGEETIKREFGVLDSIRDNFPKYVVSLDEINHSRNGIKHQNIRDFLLAEHWG
ncbi:ATP-binding protein [Murdochiella massiliensis]|uniref:ATP-binding protein n=1 Tax=Murdochiella massiliensis TaxID=1673723 RepID=UPI00082DA6C4|nr:ATP-binding protein [Murdochiella massiliensis]